MLFNRGLFCGYFPVGSLRRRAGWSWLGCTPIGRLGYAARSLTARTDLSFAGCVLLWFTPYPPQTGGTHHYPQSTHDSVRRGVDLAEYTAKSRWLITKVDCLLC